MTIVALTRKTGKNGLSAEGDKRILIVIMIRSEKRIRTFQNMAEKEKENECISY